MLFPNPQSHTVPPLHEPITSTRCSGHCNLFPLNICNVDLNGPLLTHSRSLNQLRRRQTPERPQIGSRYLNSWSAGTACDSGSWSFLRRDSRARRMMRVNASLVVGAEWKRRSPIPIFVNFISSQISGACSARYIIHRWVTCAIVLLRNWFVWCSLLVSFSYQRI